MDNLERVKIIPKDKQEWLALRTKDITSTEVSALFGISPYATIFEVWHQKKLAQILEIKENERMTWGNRLQDAIAAGIAQDLGVTVRRMDEYITIPAARIGSSFDFEITTSDGNKHILEIKNVDSLVFKNQWIKHDNGDYEAPLHIEMQVQHQLAVSGYESAYIGALVGGNRLEIIHRVRDEGVITAIFNRVSEFWHTISIELAPTPDYTRDAETISRIYNFANPGKTLDARGDVRLAQLMADYRSLGAQKSEVESKLEAIKAEILTIVQDNEKVVGDDWKLSVGVVGEADISYRRKAFRMFKPTWKKNKAEEA